MTPATDSDVLAARDGDRAAQARVFAAMEGTCAWVARRFARRLPPIMVFDDAVQVCRIAILDAIRRYEPGKAAFATFAAIWMRARLMREIMLEEAGVSPKTREWRSGRIKHFLVVALDRPADADRPAPIDTLATEDAPADELAVREVEQALQGLDPKLRHVVEGRLAGFSNEQLGREMGVSRERTRQMMSKAVVELRKALGADLNQPVMLDRKKRAEHGTSSMYASGCRCAPCRRGRSQKHRRDRELRALREAA